jgi:hypothetical protein
MTYNQVVNQLATILGNHAMIHEVKFSSPAEWLNRDNQPVFPIACYSINSGSYNLGREQTYSVQFWFLDKSGAEAEFEQEVTSDMHSVASDIISYFRKGTAPMTIDDSISWSAISDKYEDYLAGVQLTFNISTVSDFSYCDFPTV